MGYSSVTGKEGIMFADNCSFDGTKRDGSMTTDGELWIGSTAGRHVVKGHIIEGQNIGITNSSGSITVAFKSILPVTSGGTGVGTMTDGGIVLGSSTAAVTVTAQPTDGQLLIGSTGADPVLATLTEGAGVAITTAAGSITIASEGGGFDWTRVAGTTQTMVVSNGYTNANGALTTFTLPATSVVGDVMKIDGEGASLFRVSQGASQQIRMGPLMTTAGVGGYLLSSKIYDCITLRCLVADTIFQIDASQGNIGLL